MYTYNGFSFTGYEYDKAAENQGSRKGPSALRQAGTLREFENQVHDNGNVTAEVTEALKTQVKNSADPEELQMNNLFSTFAAASNLYSSVIDSLSKNLFPITFGGDHTATIGSAAAVCDYHQEQTGQKLGLIYIDAHGDINTPASSLSKNIYGIPVAVLTGMVPGALQSIGKQNFIDPANVVYLGVRDLDPGEIDIINSNNIQTVSVEETREIGIPLACQKAIEIASSGTGGFIVSMDLDACDPVESPGTGLPVPGGYSRTEALQITREFMDSELIRSFELVEFNPENDQESRTLSLCTEIISSLIDIKGVSVNENLHNTSWQHLRTGGQNYQGGSN